MLINENTKIATLLKGHPDALEAIIKISPDFKKLRNPVLRKIMAGRTSIAMASKIGGCHPEDFFTALRPLGFEVDNNNQLENEEEVTVATQEMPEYLKTVKPEQIINFDVREMLAEGNDPLKEIQKKVKSLNEGEVLVIINTFEPTPLIALLEKKGFQSYVIHKEENYIETYFYKLNGGGGTELETDIENSDDWDSIVTNYADRVREIDVRHLEMPMPMMTILENLETLPKDFALYVNHKRIPVFLLTELKERNFEYRIKHVQEGEVYLLIFRNN